MGTGTNVILFVLPPHTSHILQPMDIACFKPFKTFYYQECQKHLRNNPGMAITRYDIAQIASRAYSKGLSSDNLVSAFRKAGICPFDPNVVPAEKLAPSQVVEGQTNVRRLGRPPKPKQSSPEPVCEFLDSRVP